MNTHAKTLLLGLAAMLTGSFATAEIPRTADGKPDMSGTYNVGTSTSMQRNRIFGDNRYMTEEQAERYARATQSFCKAERRAILIEKHPPKVATVHRVPPEMSVGTTSFGFRETAPRRSARRYQLRSSTNRKTAGIRQELKNQEIEWCVDTATIEEMTGQLGGSKTKGPAHTMIPNYVL